MNSPRPTRLGALSIVGAAGAAGTSLLAMGCCFGPAVLATALTTIGLGALLSLDLGVLVPILYGMVSASLGGVAWACWRGQRWWPFGLAVAAAPALLIPFHEALAVWLFYSLVGGGQAGLLAAAILAGWAGPRREACPNR